MSRMMDRIVVVGVEAKLAVVTEVFRHAGDLLYHCHYIVSTGKGVKGTKMVCPDKRCKGEHTCPIHGQNLRLRDVTVLPPIDLDHCEQHGFISQALATKHRNSVNLYKKGK